MAIERAVQIPEGVVVKKDGSSLVVSGTNGELKRDFRHTKVKIDVSGSEIKLVSQEDETRKMKALLGTWSAIVKNMVVGVSSGWECHLKLVHSHFPAKITVKDNKVIVGNFIGERNTRETRITPGVTVKLDKELVVVSGADREKVGEVSGRIEKSTRIIGFDRRVFQDGCYIVQKTKPVGS